MSESTGSTEPGAAPEPETVDVFDNTEVEAVQGEQTSYVSRASGGGAVPEDMREAEKHEPDTTGTAGGDPLAGVTISEHDAADAVPGDTGPEHPGQHGDQTGR